jgi:hypothetical protein
MINDNTNLHHLQHIQPSCSITLTNLNHINTIQSTIQTLLLFIKHKTIINAKPPFQSLSSTTIITVINHQAIITSINSATKHNHTGTISTLTETETENIKRIPPPSIHTTTIAEPFLPLPFPESKRRRTPPL